MHQECNVWLPPSVVQPATISLFSSTGSNPLQLFFVATGHSPSLVILLHDSHDGDAATALDQTVLHIQSPFLPSTYIQCPSNFTHHIRDTDLKLKHHWMCFQVMPLQHDWSVEFGIVDQANKLGIVRLSTFQQSPRLMIREDSRLPGPPLLLLPLTFLGGSTWSTLTLNLPSFIPHFVSLFQDSDSATLRKAAIPSGMYSHIAYVKVYATCKLRRIWFSQNRPSVPHPWEMELYGGT